MKKLLALLFFCPQLSAYEVETHGLMTQQGFDYSIVGLANPTSVEVYKRLGFDRVDPAYPFLQNGLAQCLVSGEDPKQDAYIDPRPAWLASMSPDIGNRKFRCAQEYEKAAFPPLYRGLINSAALGNTTSLRLEAWVMRGAIREDDLKASRYVSSTRPDPDPWGDQDRPINHFYNPVVNSAGFPTNLAGEGALKWAMGVANPLDPASLPDANRGSHYSYVDARRNFFQALAYKIPSPVTAAGTKTDSDTRQNLWASTMLSVGHVVHLLQDQASPQHSRAEPHNYVCRGFASIFNAPVDTRTFENFINFRVVRGKFDLDARPPPGQPNYVATNPCEEKRWIKMFDEGGQTSPPLLTSWLRELGNTYPVPQFSVARKFFTTRADDGTGIGNTSLSVLNSRAGLGDYASRGFYTEGKMEGGGLYPFISPPRVTSDLSFTDGVISEVSVPGKGKVKQRGLLWAVPDAVVPNYPDPRLDASGKAPIVTYGQWGFLGGFGVRRRILTLDNYNQMADMLAPRAIAYSTGLINFFFRGKLIVEAPADGLLGAIDHGILHTVNADGYPICSITITTPENWCTTGRIYGFTKLRLRVRNDTPNIIESGTNQVVVQAMTATVASPSTGANAGLYAIARYHRNPCYKTNLTGERTYDNTTGAAIEPVGCASMRTDYQEISISKAKVVTAADLNGSSSTPMAFDFSNDPIPVNATDLIVQVVYRGQLGEETDGIAVGSIDVREPGYLTAFNSTDWGACGGQWLQTFIGGCTPSSGTASRRVNSATMCVARQPLLFYNAGTPAGLGEGQYLRVAVLSDGQLLNTRLRGLYNNISPAINTDRTFVGPVRQSAKEIPSMLEPFVSELFFSKRGRIGNNRAIPLYLISGPVDPQPTNDLGALDVGNRLPAFLLSELPRPADFTFPDAPNVISICN